MNLTRTLLLAASLPPLLVSAQKATEVTTVNRLGQTVTVVTPTRFVKTPPMREWPVVDEREIHRVAVGDDLQCRPCAPELGDQRMAQDRFVLCDDAGARVSHGGCSAAARSRGR
jgi:hypothetical protein